MKTLIPVVALILGISMGFFFGQRSADSADRDLNSPDQGQSEGLVKRDEFDREIEALKAEKQTVALDLKAAQGRAQAQDDAILALETERNGLALKAADLQAQLETLESAVTTARATRLQRIEDRFKELREKGMQNLIGSDAIGKLIADLRQEGSYGRDAVLALLKSDATEERQLAVTLLMQGMADSETIEPLHDAAMNDEDIMTKHLASQALMRMEGDEVLPTLRDLAANAKDEGVKVNSMYGLMMRGEGIDEAVAYYNNKENDENMRSALGGSAFLLEKKPEIQPLIDAVVKDAFGSPQQGQVIDAALKYYSSIKTPSALAALQKLASDPQLGAGTKAKVANAIANFNN